MYIFKRLGFLVFRTWFSLRPRDPIVDDMIAEIGKQPIAVICYVNIMLEEHVRYMDESILRIEACRRVNWSAPAQEALSQVLNHFRSHLSEASTILGRRDSKPYFRGLNGQVKLLLAVKEHLNRWRAETRSLLKRTDFAVLRRPKDTYIIAEKLLQTYDEMSDCLAASFSNKLVPSFHSP